uniref:alpha/beta hydrolase n=1 Tax=Variovorax sp. dw_308 TaxID=2721546 RepID=UPI001C452783
MRARYFIGGLVTSLCLQSAGFAQAETFQLCIRGASFDPGREFLQTRQLKLQVDGPPPGDMLLSLAGRAVRQKLWPHLELDQVQVALFDDQLCGHEPTALLELTVNAEELANIGKESGRGPTEQPQLNAVAQRAAAQAAPPRQAPAGTPSSAQRHDWIQLYYATNRQPTGETQAAQAFGSVADSDIHFGAIQVSIPADHRMANLESPSLLRLEWRANPEHHVTLGETYRSMQIDEWRIELARQAGPFGNTGVLLFVHGYNNSFQEAAKRAGQLAYDLAFPGPVVLFSWPSDGDPLAYVRDEQKALTAWRQTARVLDELSRLAPNVKVNVVAHSMGNRVFTQGMSELLKLRPGADAAFAQIVLAS